MDSADSITIEFEITRDDYVRWAKGLQRKAEEGARWQKFRASLASEIGISIVLTGFAVIAVVRKSSNPGQNDTSMLILIGVLACLAALNWWKVARASRAYGRRGIDAQLEASADTESARLWQGRKRVTLTAAFFEWDATHCVFLHRWPRVGKVRIEDGFVLVEFKGETSWPIPMSAFADLAAAERFISAAEKFRDAAATDPQDEARRLLETRDVICRGCGYNLRGTDGRKCPECGRAVSLGEVVR